MQLSDVTVASSETLPHHAIFAVAAFFVRGRCAANIRPGRPRSVRSACSRRLRPQFELNTRASALTMRGAETICAGIGAADDDDTLVFRGDEFAIRDRIAFAALVLQRQVLHCEIDPLQ